MSNSNKIKKVSRHVNEKENVSQNQDQNTSIETDPEMMEWVEEEINNVTTNLINTFKDGKENMNIMSEMEDVN